MAENKKGMFDWFPWELKKKQAVEAITDDITPPTKASVPDVPEEVPDMFDKAFFESLPVGGDKDRSISIILKKLREDAQNRETRFKDYRNAAKDSLIGQAIEMMSDDATRFDVERERTVWIESSDKAYEKKINALIQRDIEPFIDEIATGILELGEFAFRVNKISEIKPSKDKKVNKKSEIDDIVFLPFTKIEKLHHLILKDQTHWFALTSDITKFKESSDTDKIFQDDNAFLHFINYSLRNSEEVELMIDRGSGNTKKKVKEDVFILQGQAILTEKILETWRILRAIEDAIIATRLQKSKIIRFINVEVGKVDNEKAKHIVNYVDSLVNKNESITESNDSYTASRLQAEPVSVVLPVKADKGRVTVEQFSNDADIKEVADLNHFLNKLFGGLRTPKQFLGYGDEGAYPGVGSNASLMRLDIRYSRTVRKVQRVLILGVKEMIRIFNEETGEKNPPKHKVRIVAVNSPEDEERYFEMTERVSLFVSVLEQMKNPDTFQIDSDVIDVFQSFFTEVVPMNSLAMWLEKQKKEVKVKAKPPGLAVTPPPPPAAAPPATPPAEPAT